MQLISTVIGVLTLTVPLVGALAIPDSAVELQGIEVSPPSFNIADVANTAQSTEAALVIQEDGAPGHAQIEETRIDIMERAEMNTTADQVEYCGWAYTESNFQGTQMSLPTTPPGAGFYLPKSIKSASVGNGYRFTAFEDLKCRGPAYGSHGTAFYGNFPVPINCYGCTRVAKGASLLSDNTDIAKLVAADSIERKIEDTVDVIERADVITTNSMEVCGYIYSDIGRQGTQVAMPVTPPGTGYETPILAKSANVGWGYRLVAFDGSDCTGWKFDTEGVAFRGDFPVAMRCISCWRTGQDPNNDHVPAPPGFTEHPIKGMT